MNFTVVTKFEKRIAEFFGAPYAVAVDSCTHGLELCLRYTMATYVSSPPRTYISVPMLANKLGINLFWKENEYADWQDCYCINSEQGRKSIIDAAVLWGANSYAEGSFMCLSFQHQKHLSLGRGGMILCPDKESAFQLKKMSYDGRLPNIPWREQDIDTMGYHYYMTPETAQIGLDKLDEAIEGLPRIWTWNDYPDLTKMKIFSK